VRAASRARYGAPIARAQVVFLCWFLDCAKQRAGGTLTRDAPAAAGQAMPVADAPAAAPEETQVRASAARAGAAATRDLDAAPRAPLRARQAHADAAHTAPATEDDVGAREEDSGDVPEPPGGGDAGGTGADAAMPPYAYDPGAPPAFGLPDAYLPPWLQARGIARAHCGPRARHASQAGLPQALQVPALRSAGGSRARAARARRARRACRCPFRLSRRRITCVVPCDARARTTAAPLVTTRGAHHAPRAAAAQYQGPYMDVAEAYSAASAAANGGLVGAGAFALPPSPLLTPSMLGALSLSPMSMMSPTSPAGGMAMPPLYAMPDGGASFDPAAAAAALAQFQQQHMLMSPQGYMPAGPYAMAPQMYDSYDAGDALPSPRHQPHEVRIAGGPPRAACADASRLTRHPPPAARRWRCARARRGGAHGAQRHGRAAAAASVAAAAAA